MKLNLDTYPDIYLDNFYCLERWRKKCMQPVQEVHVKFRLSQNTWSSKDFILKNWITINVKVDTPLYIDEHIPLKERKEKAKYRWISSRYCRNNGLYTRHSIVTYFFAFSLGSELPVTFSSRLKVDHARTQAWLNECAVFFSLCPRNNSSTLEREYTRASTCDGLCSLHLESFTRFSTVRPSAPNCGKKYTTSWLRVNV